MTIVPDTKDWTWVLETPCPECGYDAAKIVRESVPERIGASADEFRTELVSRADVSQRPTPDVWSPLEYGCHVRDVFRRFDRRLERMLTEDDPRFDNWDQDATAVEDRYGEQDPPQVAVELGDAARPDRRPLRAGPARRVGSAGPAQRRRPVHGGIAGALPVARPRAPRPRHHRTAFRGRLNPGLPRRRPRSPSGPLGASMSHPPVRVSRTSPRRGNDRGVR